MPASKASSSSAALIENDFSWPRMSVNQKRMKRMLCSATNAFTSSGVLGCSSATGYRLIAEPAGARYRRVAKRGSQLPASVAGDGRYESGHVFGFLALVEQRRHLPVAAGPAFEDRVQHQRPATRVGGDVIADADVEVRTRCGRRSAPLPASGSRRRSGRTVPGPWSGPPSRCTPPTASLALWLPLWASTSVGTTSPKAISTTTPSDRQAPAGLRFRPRPSSRRRRAHGGPRGASPRRTRPGRGSARTGRPRRPFAGKNISAPPP